MSNSHPDRPIAQPRRRFNRTASTNSVGSAGSPAGSTNPMPHFAFGNPLAAPTAATPPVQPTFGGFGTAGTPPNFSGFNTQPVQQTGFHSDFSSPSTNLPATSATTPSLGFGGFGAPSVPSSTTNQPFGGFGAPSIPSSTANQPFGGFTPQNNPTTSFSGAFGSSNTPTSSSAGGFQAGSRSSSDSVFGGFGKQSQPPKTDDHNVDSDEQPTEAPSFSGFGSSQPQTSAPSSAPAPAPAPAPSLTFSLPSAEQKKPASPFAGFTFGKPATSSALATKPLESAASPFGGSKPLGSKQLKDADEPAAEPTAKSPPSKTTPSPFTGFAQPIPSAKITEIDPPHESDKDEPSTSASPKPVTATIQPPTFSFNASSTKPAEKNPTKDGQSAEKPAISFGSFTTTATTATTTTTTAACKKRDRDTDDGINEQQSHKKRDRDTDDDNIEHKKSNTSLLPAPKSASTPTSGFSFTSDQGTKDVSFSTANKDSSSPFTFGAVPAATTDKSANKASSSPFTFGAVPAATTDQSANKASSSPFTFGAVPAATTDQSANKASSSPFTFGAVPAATTTAKSDQSAKEISSISTNKDSSSPFRFGSTPAATTTTPRSDQSAKEATVAPTFTFGKAAPNPSEKKDAGTFTFGAAANASNAEKKEAPTSFSFGSPAPKKTFSFGSPPSTADSATTEAAKTTSTAADTNKIGFSFGSAAAAGSSNPSFGVKTSADKTKNVTTASEADSAAASTPLIHGKSPLSKSTTFEASSKEGEKDEASTSTGKRVGFFMPDTSYLYDTSTAASKPSEPASVSLAFSKVNGTDDTTAPAATLSIFPSTKKEASSSGTSSQTTLKSSITDMNQITYKTRFWELPDDARNELALLAHFITEQTDKKDKIDQELGSYFGSTLKEMHTNAITMNDDAVILGEKLEVQSKSIDDLIVLNKEQRLNAASASNVQKQESMNWRIHGATENWNFFSNAIANMEERFGQLSEMVTSVEEAIHGLQSPVQFTPQHVGTLLDEQRKMYLSLAGRVADIHQEADRVFKRRKLTN